MLAADTIETIIEGSVLPSVRQCRVFKIVGRAHAVPSAIYSRPMCKGVLKLVHANL